MKIKSLPSAPILKKKKKKLTEETYWLNIAEQLEMVFS